MQKTIEKIFVDIIQKYLDLPNDYGKDEQGNTIPCVSIQSQNIKLFNTPKLQITVGTLSNQLFSNRKYFETVLIENQEYFQERVVSNERRTIQIDAYSRNNEAIERFNEIQLALKSTYAEQQQDKYQFRIGTISNANNLSGADGGSDINRFSIRVECIIWHEKIKRVDWYEHFSVNVRDNKKELFEIRIDKEQG